MAEDNSSAATQNTEPSTTTQPTTPATQAANTEEIETYTKDQLTKIVSQRLKEQKSQFEKQLEDATKTETERLASEVAQLKAEKVQRETKDEVTALLQKNGCKRPEAAFLLVKGMVTRDKDGKLEDTKALLAEAKQLAPEFFDDPQKRTGSADAGAKENGETKSVGQTMNDLIRGAAGRKVN